MLPIEHILIFSEDKSYQIQTPDGEIHKAELVNTVEFGDRDLGLLKFRSTKEYEVTSLSHSSRPKKGEEVFAAGFPFEADPSQNRGFVFTKGNISLLSEKAFGGGYKIGYTNDVQKGMSGGPVFNRQGEVIGINGVHKYPLWGNPYLFEDGTVASKAKQEEMSQFSWAIPVQTFLQLAPQFDRGNVR